MKAALATGALLSGPLLLAATGGAGQGSDHRTNITHPAITGTFTDAARGQGAFTGNIALARFEVQHSSLVAVGTLTGVLADSTGSVLARVTEEAILPVTVVSATCQLLHLDIGPLELELLGVQVQLERDALGITTREGPSRALLCSTARLLAGNPPPEAVAPTLNGVLGKMNPRR